MGVATCSKGVGGRVRNLSCLLSQAYLWHNNEAVVEWLEGQEGSKSIVRENADCIKRDRIMRQVCQ